MYFITCIEKDGTEIRDGKPDYGDIRTFGYLKTYEEAKKALNENWCDMYEYLYSYAVIEHIEPGILNEKEIKEQDRTWFQYNHERDGFFEIEKPNNNKELIFFR